MSWVVPKFRPGLNKLDQYIAGEGGYVDAHGMRFYQHGVQPIGGWAKHSAAAFTGNARAAMAWRTLEAVKCLAWGTTSKLYSELAGTRTDITPNLLQTVLTNCFTAVNGSTTFTVYLPFHMLQVGDSFTLSNHQSTVGSRTLEGTFTVASVPTPGTFTFVFGSASNADVTTPSGGNVDIVIPLPAHFDTWSLASWGENLLANPSGYGLFEYQPETAYAELIFNGTLTGNANGWALGTGWAYGTNNVVATAGTASNFSQAVDGVVEPGRTYKLSFTLQRTAGSLKVQMNVGVDASPTPYQVTFDTGFNNVHCPGLAGQLASGMLVQFQTTGTLPTPLATSTNYRIVDVNPDGSFELSGVTSFSGGSGTHTMTVTPPSAAVIDIGTVSAPIDGAVGLRTYTRLFVCPADPLDLVFAKNSSFAGTIDNISLKLMDTAYRVMTAPPRIDAMFTDPRGLVVALGTTDLDQGQYSATMYRCSDLGNNRSWVPDVGSLASQQIVRGIGGRLMGGISTAEQNLVGGDEGVASFVYQGVAGDAFKITMLGTGCGWISRHCAAGANGIVLWMSNAAKFFIFGGTGIGSLGKPVPIGCPIEQDVFGHLDEAEWGVIHCGLDLAHQEAWFFYPDNRDAGSECSRVAAVAWTEVDSEGAVPWMLHQIARQAWVASGTFANPIGFGASSGSNYVYDHEFGQTADGSAIGEYIETAPFDLDEGEFLTVLRRIVPDLESSSGDVRFYVKARNTPKGAERTFGPFTATQVSTFLDMRIMARQVVLRIEGATSGGFWRMLGLRMDLMKSGAKR